jgi:isocitrate dehydrogenase (NAD+)
MLLAGCMLLEHLDQHEVSARIRESIRRTLEERKTVTPDVGGTARTEEYAAAVIAGLR